jgi:hypothetical protein
MTSRARTRTRTTWRRLRVVQLTTDGPSRMPVVVLATHGDRERMRLGIGLSEAGAIAAELERIKLERPITHDLLAQVIGALGGSVERIDLGEVKDGIYYATLWLGKEGRTVGLDCRPSDGIALALRTAAPIYVAAEVLAAAGERAVPPPSRRGASRSSRGQAAPPPPPALSDSDYLRELLASLPDEEFGKWKM